MARTFRKISPKPGRSPKKDTDLPEKRPLAWKVPLEWHGPSGKTAPGMEGPPEKRRTFLKNGLWHGRFPRNGTDLPGNKPLAWKVPLEWHRPSGKTASGPEGFVDGGVGYIVNALLWVNYFQYMKDQTGKQCKKLRIFEEI